MTTMNSLTAQLSASQQRETEFRELIEVLECPNCKGVGWYMQYVRDAEELEKVECQICADIAAFCASTASDFVRTEEVNEDTARLDFIFSTPGVQIIAPDVECGGKYLTNRADIDSARAELERTKK